MYALGTRSTSVPSVVLIRTDGSVLTEEPAVRRALAEPDRVAREFQRRLGDSTPVAVDVNLRPGRNYTVTVTPFNGKVAGPGSSATGATLT